jgi:MFS family permease
MAFASLAGAGCMLAFSQAETLTWMISLALLTGLVQESGNPATSALIQDLIPPEHRVNAYAVLRFAVNLGWSLGPACAGWLAEHSFTWLFLGDAATSAVFGIIALLALPKGNPSPPGKPAGSLPSKISQRIGLSWDSPQHRYSLPSPFAK